MITKYRIRVSPRNRPTPRITKVDVERETPLYVWIDGKRCQKESGYLKYYDSWEEAKVVLMEQAKIRLDDIAGKYERTELCFNLIQALKNEGV